MAYHNELGKRGEGLAANYLIENGYQVVERNWIGERHEIDIVAINSEFVIFVEVKTRGSDYWGRPEEAVSKAKMKRMVDAASYYLETSDLDLPVRFDIIAITKNGGKIKINHIEDAFLPSFN